MTKRKTVFFDLDGTLTDPKPGITGSIQHALQRLGAPIPPADELTPYIGPRLLDSLCSLVGATLAPQALAFYRERFAAVGLYENSVYPGVPQLLEGLIKSGTRVYVASSKPEVYVIKILEHFRLRHYFSGVFGSGLDGTRSDKTELLRFALAATNSQPGSTTMVGDRQHDVIGATDNGIRIVGVLYGYGSAAELRNAGAQILAKRPSELLALLLS